MTCRCRYNFGTVIDTSPTSGVFGFWSRTGTAITTATAGDDLALGGDVTLTQLSTEITYGNASATAELHLTGSVSGPPTSTLTIIATPTNISILATSTDLTLVSITGDIVLSPSGSINLASGQVWKSSTKTADYSLLTSDFVVFLDGTSNTVEALFPSAPVTGQVFIIKAINTDNACTIGRNGKNIENAASDITLALNVSLTLLYDGTEWWIL